MQAAAAAARRYRRILEQALGVPATDGNRLELLRNGDEAFPALLHEIGAAERTLDVLTFAWWGGDVPRRVADALVDRAAAGVRVRLLLDSFGARWMDDDVRDRLDGSDVDVGWFRPRLAARAWEAHHRTHRRAVVRDGEVAMTGGIGIADEWAGDGRSQGSWRDTHARIHGPAVAGVRGAFLDNWAEVRAELVDERDRFPPLEPAGDVPLQVLQGGAEVGWNAMATFARVLLAVAERRVRISTAYLAPDDETLGALLAAAGRGVEVEAVTAGPRVDKRIGQLAGEAKYEALLDAGVRVHHYQPSMFHAKTITVDGAVGCVGTVNFDSRSFGMDEEVEVVAFSPAVAGELDADFEADLEHSERITSADWADRSLVQRAEEAVVDVFADHI